MNTNDESQKHSPRKVQVVKLDAESLVDLFKRREIHTIVERPLPKDAKVLGVRTDPQVYGSKRLEILVHSDTFQEAEQGATTCPRRGITLTDVPCKK
jgi:ferredoxin